MSLETILILAIIVIIGGFVSFRVLKKGGTPSPAMARASGGSVGLSRDSRRPGATGTMTKESTSLPALSGGGGGGRTLVTAKQGGGQSPQFSFKGSETMSNDLGTPLLGQLLLKAGLINEEQLNDAVKDQKITGKRIGSILMKKGVITEEVLITFLSRQYNVPAINLSTYRIDTTLARMFKFEEMKRHQFIPVSMDGANLRVAVADPSNNHVINEIKFVTGMKVSVYVAAETAIAAAIDKYSTKDERVKVTANDLQKIDTLGLDELNSIIGSALDEFTVVEDQEDDEIQGNDAPIVKLANSILMNAIKSRASDIHVEPSEDLLRVRYRIDGVLQPVLKLPVKIKNALTSRIKIISHLDISERRLPQDGRMKLRFGEDREIDFRVSTVPALYGEKIVMRLLDKQSLRLDLAQLGFEAAPLQEFLEGIEKPYGMLLVTGPTGSGKTTTLYSALQRLNRPGVNIMTAEDPVEYNFFGINQIQIREDINLTFASALRSFLRQDPDIIMVGEIRDFETAEISVKAALTGHLVLRTLHTNDAPSAITRLIDMKIEPFLVSSSLVLIIAQRLVRKICENCKEVHKTNENVLLKMGFTPEDVNKITLYMGMGCSECNNSGYNGRMAIYEVMPVRDELREMILRDASSVEIKREAIRLGMETLRQSGIKKIKAGLTTVDEVVRVTFED